jgi:molybdopterin/thiamine biosynthesis adenylyltransferase
LLTIGREWRRGQAFGLVALASGIQPIDRVKLVGPGMHMFPLRMMEPSRPAGPETTRNGSPELTERWSRTIGALGAETWQRLAGLTYGIVGVGRTGSVLAQSMAAGWGAEHLVLIDPDRVEVHNLGEMAGFAEQDIGRWKAEAVAARLRPPSHDRPEVTALTESITHVRSLRAIQACDVVFGGVDHDGARLAAAVLATLFCKPYVDVATGIHGAGDRRQMGADIRLTVPGNGRCLLCLGGLADPAGARQTLASAEWEQAFRLTRDWQQERQGSLRSLNQVAASIALRLWEEFMAERLRESTWVHLEFNPAGRLEVSYPPAQALAPCRLCRLMGLGEEGLPRIPEIIQGEIPQGRA